MLIICVENTNVYILFPTESFGEICYDVAYGGSYYIYTDITQFGLDVQSSPASEIVLVAQKFIAAVAASVTLTHPEHNEFAFFSAVYFYCGSLGSLSDTITELCIYDEMVSVIVVLHFVTYAVVWIEEGTWGDQCTLYRSTDVILADREA